MQCSKIQSIFEINTSNLLTFLRSDNSKGVLQTHERNTIMAVQRHFLQSHELIQHCYIQDIEHMDSTIVLAPYICGSQKTLLVMPSLYASKRIQDKFGVNSYLVSRKIIVPPDRHIHPLSAIVTTINVDTDLTSELIITSSRVLSSIIKTLPAVFDLVMVMGNGKVSIRDVQRLTHRLPTSKIVWLEYPK
jgi:hypothetical protein